MDLPETAQPDRKTVVVLTTHKAGSTIVTQIIAALHASIGVPAVNLASMAWQQGIPAKQFIEENASLMDRPGYLFGALRSPLIDNLGDFAKQRAILHVRDPRDCIVSFYFSMTQSHAEPPGQLRKKFQETRERLNKLSIDAYALRRAVGFEATMDRLAQISASHPDRYISKYEDMVTRTDAWLEELCGFLDIEITPTLRKKLEPLLDFSISEERPDQHKRQILPGDHLRKLEPKTIARLTEMLRKPLEAFDYLSDAQPEQARATG